MNKVQSFQDLVDIGFDGDLRKALLLLLILLDPTFEVVLHVLEDDVLN